MDQLVEKTIVCPYCAELIAVLIDSTDVNQQYIEDCQVCCKPIVFLISETVDGDHVVSVYNEDDAF
ncbi:CPXCG motif-containing cysteine-rich protein [Vibrio sp. F74]|uniref:CPXCG motif-containing cysteine-rich protein n=1 Tax=Vibrio sp. F74 TaxID=700020 RepID=UPI0035F5DBAF